jgi:hypothetical protein
MLSIASVRRFGCRSRRRSEPLRKTPPRIGGLNGYWKCGRGRWMCFSSGFRLTRNRRERAASVNCRPQTRHWSAKSGTLCAFSRSAKTPRASWRPRRRTCGWEMSSEEREPSAFPLESIRTDQRGRTVSAPRPHFRASVEREEGAAPLPQPTALKPDQRGDRTRSETPCRGSRNWRSAFRPETGICLGAGSKVVSLAASSSASRCASSGASGDPIACHAA